MLLSKIFLGSVVYLAFIQQTIAFCTWKLTHLLAPTYFNKNAVSKVYRVRSAMHCVLKCSQTDQCQAVGFSRNLCILYRERGTIRETPSKKSVALLVQKVSVANGKRFVGHQMQLNQHVMRNRKTSLSVRSQTTAIMKLPASTEGSPIATSSISTSVPSTTRSVQADKKMTQEGTWGPYWIGLMIRESGGIWVDGTSISYCHSRVKNSDKANPALCVGVIKSPFTGWRKKTCQSTMANFVCEIV